MYFCVAQAAVARFCINYFDELDLFEGGPREKAQWEKQFVDPMVTGEFSKIQQVAKKVDECLDWVFMKWAEHWHKVSKAEKRASFQRLDQYGQLNQQQEDFVPTSGTQKDD
jgi:hypothetical protein